MPTSISAWFNTRGIAATPGYSVFILPWAGVKAHSGWETRDQGSALLGGGWLRSSGTQNNYIEWDIWLEAGTYKCALIYRRNTDAGIFHIQLDGVDKGTVDSYAAAFDNNNYTEVGSIAVASAGLKTFTLKMASKNASSSNYAGNIQSCAWIRTGA